MIIKADMIKLASELCKLGKEVDESRQTLKDLVEAGVPYESDEMRVALEDFHHVYFRWEKTEQEYLILRQKVLKDKG